MSDPVAALAAIGNISEGGLKLLKKIPMLGDFIRYREGIESMDGAIDASFASELRIINDPAAQLAFINQVEPEYKQAALGRIIEVQQGYKKHINIAEILMMTIEELQHDEISTTEISDEPIHEDWWMRWIEAAQMTSDPIKREVFSKLLAYEARRTGFISPKTIRVLADLPVEDIARLKKVSNYLCEGGYYYTFNLKIPDDIYVDLQTLRPLAESELITILTPGVESRHYNGKEKVGNIDLYFFNFSIRICNVKSPLKIYYFAKLTREGMILRNILGLKISEENIKKYAKHFDKVIKEQVTLHPIENGEVITSIKIDF